MLHLIYIIAFTVIASITITNLIRSLISVSLESTRRYGNASPRYHNQMQGMTHPELFDDKGQPINEPLIVMRSVSVEDAREQLDRLYQSSPGGQPEDFDV